jgi:hypothetical protein
VATESVKPDLLGARALWLSSAPVREKAGARVRRTATALSLSLRAAALWLRLRAAQVLNPFEPLVKLSDLEDAFPPREEVEGL